MLSDSITREMVQLQVKAENWEDAVRAGGQLLLNADICEDRYVDAMVAAVREMGPYMVLAPGIALAHGRPEDGVLKVGLSIINLETPVEFGSEANDPVSLVISFGGVDKESHVGLLQELAIFLMEEKNQVLLKTASDIDQIMEAFS
ncbi:MAG: PTS sugar transporter subunit IIA [Chloroflexi bacterium]|nr:PTS sugar transporter subunit IIA [Chloroflexota bacterium]